MGDKFVPATKKKNNIIQDIADSFSTVTKKRGKDNPKYSKSSKSAAIANSPDKSDNTKR